MTVNVLFEYLYRDGSNYKNWGEAVFNTTSGLDITELNRQIQQFLIDGEFFVAEYVGVAPVYFTPRDIGVDHWWHEYSGVSWTDKSTTQLESIEQFIDRLKLTQNNKATC